MEFKQIEKDSMREILECIRHAPYGTCDFTVGSIYMWADYLNYTYTISDDMLLLKGQAESEMGITVFALPVGAGDMGTALTKIEDYCKQNQLLMEFSAVPEGGVEILKQYYDCNVTELYDWQDYVYRAQDLRELKGRRYRARRNHINYFTQEYPDYVYREITPADVPRLLKFCDDVIAEHDDKSRMHLYEHQKTKVLLTQLESFKPMGFKGGYVQVGEDIVAFSIGEVLGNMLFVHVEKALRQWRGSYEIINMEFARHHAVGKIDLVNREEDVGDPGLRAAKMAYHPVKMLKKHNVAILGKKPLKS